MVETLKTPQEVEPEDAALRNSEMSIGYWRIHVFGFPLPLFPSPQVKPLAQAASEIMEQKNTSIHN